MGRLLRWLRNLFRRRARRHGRVVVGTVRIEKMVLSCHDPMNDRGDPDAIMRAFIKPLEKLARERDPKDGA